MSTRTLSGLGRTLETGADINTLFWARPLRSAWAPAERPGRWLAERFALRPGRAVSRRSERPKAEAADSDSRLSNPRNAGPSRACAASRIRKATIAVCGFRLRAFRAS